MKYKKYILLILVVATSLLSSCTNSNYDKGFDDCFDSVYPELEMALEEKGQLFKMFFDFCSQGNTIKLNETWNAGIFQITYNLEKLDKYSNDNVLSNLISNDVGLTYKFKFTSKYKIEDYLIYDAEISAYNLSENFPLKYYIYYLDEENIYTEYMQSIRGLNLGFGKIINTQDGFIEDFEQIDDIIKITKELYILLFIDGNPYAITLILE